MVSGEISQIIGQTSAWCWVEKQGSFSFIMQSTHSLWFSFQHAEMHGISRPSRLFVSNLVTDRLLKNSLTTRSMNGFLYGCSFSSSMNVWLSKKPNYCTKWSIQILSSPKRSVKASGENDLGHAAACMLTQTLNIRTTVTKNRGKCESQFFHKIIEPVPCKSRGSHTRALE